MTNMFVRLFIQKSDDHLFCVFVFEAMHIWLAAEASYMMYTHVERRRRSIICRPAAQGDHRGGKAGSAGRARAAPLWVYSRVRPPARPAWRACGGTDRPRSRQLWAVGVAGAGAHRVAVAELSNDQPRRARGPRLPTTCARGPADADGGTAVAEADRPPDPPTARSPAWA